MSERIGSEPYTEPYIAGLNFPEAVGFPALEDLEQSSFDLGIVMERRLEQLDARPPTIHELDADRYLSGRLQQLPSEHGGVAGYVDKVTD